MADDLQHWLNLIRATKARLQRLEEQKATYGFATPPHIDAEIAQANKDLEVYQGRLKVGPPPSEKAQNAVEGDAQQVLIEAKLKEIKEANAAALTSVIETVNRIDAKTETIGAKVQAIDIKASAIDAKTEAYRDADNEVRIERQQENDQKFTALGDTVDMLLDMVQRANGRSDWVLWRVGLIVLGAQIVTILVVWWITHGEVFSR